MQPWVRGFADLSMLKPAAGRPAALYLSSGRVDAQAQDPASSTSAGLRGEEEGEVMPLRVPGCQEGLTILYERCQRPPEATLAQASARPAALQNASRRPGQSSLKSCSWGCNCMLWATADHQVAAWDSSRMKAACWRWESQSVRSIRLPSQSGHLMAKRSAWRLVCTGGNAGSRPPLRTKRQLEQAWPGRGATADAAQQGTGSRKQSGARTLNHFPAGRPTLRLCDRATPMIAVSRSMRCVGDDAPAPSRSEQDYHRADARLRHACQPAGITR